MMLFTIVDSFSPADGEGWTGYCEWRGIQFERFDSIDGSLRPNLFDTPEDSDWPHIVNESFMLHLITDFAHARRKHAQIGKGDLVGVRMDDHDPSHEGFLGFDILDGYWDISLLTNWGNDFDFINETLARNALVPDQTAAERIFERLKSDYDDDAHVEGCRVVSLYHTEGVDFQPAPN